MPTIIRPCIRPPERKPAAEPTDAVLQAAREAREAAHKARAAERRAGQAAGRLRRVVRASEPGDFRTGARAADVWGAVLEDPGHTIPWYIRKHRDGMGTVMAFAYKAFGAAARAGLIAPVETSKPLEPEHGQAWNQTKTPRTRGRIWYPLKDREGDPISIPQSST